MARNGVKRPFISLLIFEAPSINILAFIYIFKYVSSFTFLIDLLLEASLSM